MNVELKRATLANLDELLILVRAYHDFERIEHTDESRRAARRLYSRLGFESRGRFHLMSCYLSNADYWGSSDLLAICFPEILNLLKADRHAK